MQPARESFPVTERLRLRYLTAQDAELLVALDSDPEVMRYISFGRPTPRAQIEGEHLPRILHWNSQGPGIGVWAAELRSSGEFIGWFHLRPDKFEPADMELGYRLKRQFWGQGLATEMGGELVRRAFSTWGFTRVSGRTLIGNVASRRVLEKCGLGFDSEFTYPESMLPGGSETQRRAVKYLRNSP